MALCAASFQFQGGERKTKPIPKISCWSQCQCYKGSKCRGRKKHLREAGLLDDLNLADRICAFVLHDELCSKNEKKKRRKRRMHKGTNVMEFVKASLRLSSPVSPGEQDELAKKAYATSRFLFHVDLSTPALQRPFKNVYKDTVDKERTEKEERMVTRKRRLPKGFMGFRGRVERIVHKD